MYDFFKKFIKVFKIYADILYEGMYLKDKLWIKKRKNK